MGSAGLLQMLHAMQKSVTVVKKQDQKLRKILQEKETRKKQFIQYKEDTKKAFAKQVHAYEMDRQRLDAEYASAMETGQVATATSRPPQRRRGLELAVESSRRGSSQFRFPARSI